MKSMESRGFTAAFGREVQRLRTALGLSLRELAELSGLTTSYITSIELGKRDLSLSTIVALAEALGISPAELFESPGGLSPSAVEMATLWSEVSPDVQAAIVDVLRAIKSPP
jgi:transcriptional regulator with XRE-family HTH domain